MASPEPCLRLSTYVVFVDYGAEIEVQHTVRGSTLRVDRAEYEGLLEFQGFRESGERQARWVDAGVLVPPFVDAPEYHGGLRPHTEAQLARDYQDWYWRHEVESERDYRWLGRTLLKMPSDLFFYQELLVAGGLRTVLEIGHGDAGALSFFATVLGWLGGGEIVGVDREGASELGTAVAPTVGVHLLRGDANEPAILQAIRSMRPQGFGLVIIDAEPEAAGKLRLLRTWADAVAPDGVLVVEDMESPACRRSGEALRSVDGFLLDRRDFGIAIEAARSPLLKARGVVFRRHS